MTPGFGQALEWERSYCSENTGHTFLPVLLIFIRVLLPGFPSGSKVLVGPPAGPSLGLCTRSVMCWEWLCLQLEILVRGRLVEMARIIEQVKRLATGEWPGIGHVDSLFVFVGGCRGYIGRDDLLIQGDCLLHFSWHKNPRYFGQWTGLWNTLYVCWGQPRGESGNFA